MDIVKHAYGTQPIRLGPTVFIIYKFYYMKSFVYEAI